MLTELLRFDGKRFYYYGIYFFFVTHLLDWATTFFGAKVMGFSETNDVMSDPLGNPLLFKALVFKFLFALFVVYVLGKVLQVATKSYTLAGIVWFYFAFHNYYVASSQNLLLMFEDVWSRLGL